MGTASRKARADMAATAKALADLGDGADPKKLAAPPARTRTGSRPGSVPTSGLPRRSPPSAPRAVSCKAQAERRLVGEIHAANAAYKEQLALVGRINAKAAAERGLAGGMGGTGRAQLAVVEANGASRTAWADPNRQIAVSSGSCDRRRAVGRTRQIGLLASGGMVWMVYVLSVCFER
jgi:hypothetical protein